MPVSLIHKLDKFKLLYTVPESRFQFVRTQHTEILQVFRGERRMKTQGKSDPHWSDPPELLRGALESTHDIM